MSDNNENKPVELKQFKRRRTMDAFSKADDQLRATMWHELCALWGKYTDEAARVPATP